MTAVAAGFAGMLALVTPVSADEEVIEHKKTESMRVETAPAAPVVRERVIEQQAPAAVVQKKSSKTVVKGDDNDDIDDDDDND
jgi:hypothetical protein